MSNKREKHPGFGIQALLYGALLCTVSAVLYEAVFVRAYTPPTAAKAVSEQKPQEKPDISEASSEISDDISASSQESLSTQTWPEGTDLGYAITPADQQISKTILLDAGHGGSDGGHIAADGTLEKNLTLEICRRIKAHLEIQNPSLNVVMLRDSDDIDSWSTSSWADLTYRMKQQEEVNPDYFLSIHVDDLDNPEEKGYQFYLNSDDPVASDLAARISIALQEAGFSGDRGIVTTEQYPLQNISMSNAHAMQLELGALSNADDLADLKNEDKLDRICAAVAYGISSQISEQPDAPAYQSRQKQVQQKAEEERQRRLEEEKKKQEEEQKKKEQESAHSKSAD